MTTGSSSSSDIRINTLGKGDLRNVVKLPDGVDLDEWLADNTADFYNELDILVKTMFGVCTEESCPKMTAGPKYEYLWADGDIVQVPIRCSAPFYTASVLTWIEKLLRDESVFPVRVGTPFPRNFRKTIEQISRRMFRIFAHVYRCHSSDIASMGEEPHVNTSFKRFVFFIKEFGLVQQRELDALRNIIQRMNI